MFAVICSLFGNPPKLISHRVSGLQSLLQSTRVAWVTAVVIDGAMTGNLQVLHGADGNVRLAIFAV